MRVLVAGATGAMGRQLVPLLVRAGHEVHGMTRSESKQAFLRGLGAAPVVADALDPEQVARAVSESRPEVVVHQLTAIGPMDLPHFDRAFAQTNRLRTEGTDHLLTASRDAGVTRFVAQSFFAGYDRVGGSVKTEDDPFGTAPPPGMEQTVGAIRHVEDSVLGASWTQGLVLRYGGFYGPHTSLGVDGEQTDAVRRRKFPVVGDGGGVWSFVHIADAAEATVAAVERGAPGVYNIVDDEPASVATWLPVLAESLGARAPMRVPRLVGRLLAGETGTVMMTELRGASNAKAKQELGWVPRHATWRDGFRELGARARAESGAAA
jgi:nucleoside-diphosphate-sugar epimerase